MEETKNTLPVKRLFGIKIIRYRIVRDSFLGFECQIWYLWYPFWTQMGLTNTHRSIEKAIAYINNNTNKVVLSS